MKIFQYLFLVSILVVAPGLSAQAAGDGVASIIDNARDECRSFENGALTVDDTAIVKRDLTGDGIANALIDGGKFKCSTIASLYCGTGGCSLFAIVDGKTYNFLAKGWKVVDWGKVPVLLLAVHGAECGGSNLRRCYKALTWSESDFQSISGQ